jgi:hypothetical protein
MPVNFQDFGPKLRRSIAKVLFCWRIERPCVRVVFEPMLSGLRYCTGVRIIVRQARLAGFYLRRGNRINKISGAGDGNRTRSNTRLTY